MRIQLGARERVFTAAAASCPRWSDAVFFPDVSFYDNIEVSGHGKVAAPFPFRPFLTVSAVRVIFPGLNEDDVEGLVHGGFLIAFDIGMGTRRHRELRILPESADHFRQHGKARVMDIDWQVAEGFILNGYAEPTLTGKQARLLLNCSITQVTNLIPIQLKVAPGTTWCRGPKGSPRILVSSLLRFLKSRLVY